MRYKMSGLVGFLLLALASCPSLIVAPNVNLLSRLVPSSRNGQSSATCGYSSCPSVNPNKLNVHLTAHTHDDVGWLKTVDQYYYGTNRYHSRAGVQFILDTVIPALIMDEEKRFIYVEVSFFAKWWNEQDDTMKKAVRELVQEGRLEFINGGWCMNDEATVTYRSTIEQMTIGLRFLKEEFGPCAHPKVGWQIDPFGHSNEQASLFAQFGFDGMYFTRMTASDKTQRTLNKSLELIWHGDRALSGQSGSIFTSIFRDGYDAPNGYCFDALCADNFLVDNKKSYEYNMDVKGDGFIEYLRDYAKSRLTDNILIPMGGDFQYSSANQNFKALDKMIKYIRDRAPDLHIFYSTPSCYQNAAYQEIKRKGIKLPEKYDDFMPYASSETVWWSGYFSSRPSVKLIERQVADVLGVSRVASLERLIRQPQKNWTKEVRRHESDCLMPIWEILGDLQHHDAITGTEQQHVSNDYVRRSSNALVKCAEFLGRDKRDRLDESIKKHSKYPQLKESGKPYRLDSVYLEKTELCLLLNISQCDPLESEVNFTDYETVNLRTQLSDNLPHHMMKRAVAANAILPKELGTKSVLLSIHNPLAMPVKNLDVRIPCISKCDLEKIRVIHLATNETMKLVRLPNPSGISSLPFREAQTTHEVLFYADVPPLGYTTYVVEDNNVDSIIEEEEEKDSFVITDGTSHKQNGGFRSRRLGRSPKSEYFEMDMGHSGPGRSKRDTQSDRVIVKFETSTGTIVGLKRVKDGSVLNITQKFGYYWPADSMRPPGAYTFRPNSSEPTLLEKPISYKMYKRSNGALIEIHQKWADWIWQTIRVDANKNYIEFDYVVGPIPIREQLGREVITRYITSMTNKGAFLTDSNARQMLSRHRYPSKQPEDLGGSFFPVASTLMLRDLSTPNEVPNHGTVDAVAILVDRPQAGTSLNEGQMELLVHRRMTQDDGWGVGEPLDEPGEDGRGLVSRGKHRLYLKFRDAQDQPQVNSDFEGTDPAAVSKKEGAKTQMFELSATPRANLAYERQLHINGSKSKSVPTRTYIVHDKLYNELRRESVKLAQSPVLTFDRLRVSADDFIDMITAEGLMARTEMTLLNATLPNNVHLLTLQPWIHDHTVLIRLENLDNPLTLHPFPNPDSFKNMYDYYLSTSDFHEVSTSKNSCDDLVRPKLEVDIEYLIRGVRITSIDELNLGADVRLKEDKRINWTEEIDAPVDCSRGSTATSVKLGPRQIRTFLANIERL